MKPCPFCGSAMIRTDTLAGRTKTMYRKQCDTCMAKTGWKETEDAAAEAWGRRQDTGAGPPQAIINDDLFFLNGAVYFRHPKTGTYFCNAMPNSRDSRGKRIAKAAYLEALTNCKGGP